MVNKREQTVKEEALKLGWDVLRNGWPDFLLYDKNTNQAILIEVKSCNKSGVLSKEQKKMHKILRKLGLNVQTIQVGANIEKQRQRIKTQLQLK